MGQANYVNGFRLTLHEQALELPLMWRKPQMIFVNSMSDLFHERVPLEFTQKVFDVMCRANQHRYQLLTKRSQQLLNFSSQLPWPENVWMGVSVENADYTFRVDHLRQTPAKTKFLSLEPLLGAIRNLDLTGIDWVIVGGESGPKARPMNPEWVTNLRDQCLESGVAFYFKQWGGVNKKKAGRLLDGLVWDQMPTLAATGC